MSKIVVLASGGLDSTVTAAIAKSEGDELYFLTVDYGQRHRTEIECAQKISEYFEVKEHKLIRLDLRTFGGSALTDQIPVPTNRTGRERAQQIPVTYVPARNTIFLSLALAYAEVLNATSIFFGANIRDYSGYPDCRPEFIQAFKEVARLGTRMGLEGQPVDILAPLLFLTKREIIQKGHALGVPFQWTNSCYNPGLQNQPCGHCDSCVIRQEGFKEAQLPDPLLAR
ncbi:7-cyano-7-deazaguanine synthase QueC [Candidatus Nitrospira allomarina]|uniref:7-cyano-7-deazaguanine synthase n=1 Tax=Candidatus Nitrospira allomarina TaxID=3020900 RepID=A0AA96GDX3_9BACT|nr:7-cyano-7-deazaguanine synthase QueC [Candidatus Nitrospira allomarina]WNM57123.1 7-cyano-7-deazaguanine synthase QueC [Candidatus Nitrospira allomarina]